MARITVEDCLEKVDNQYDLVLLAKERTSQLNSGSEMLVEPDNDKNTVIALREIAEGKIDTKDLKSNAILRLRKEPDESAGEEEQDEITNDDFESQYKGEVSKSGTPILPSKRARKVPEKIKFSKEDIEELKGSTESNVEAAEEKTEEGDVSLEEISDAEKQDSEVNPEDTNTTNS